MVHISPISGLADSVYIQSTPRIRLSLVLYSSGAGSGQVFPFYSLEYSYDGCQTVALIEGEVLGTLLVGLVVGGISSHETWLFYVHLTIKEVPAALPQ